MLIFKALSVGHPTNHNISYSVRWNCFNVARVMLETNQNCYIE